MWIDGGNCRRRAWSWRRLLAEVERMVFSDRAAIELDRLQSQLVGDRLAWLTGHDVILYFSQIGVFPEVGFEWLRLHDGDPRIMFAWRTILSRCEHHAQGDAVAQGRLETGMPKERTDTCARSREVSR